MSKKRQHYQDPALLVAWHVKRREAETEIKTIKYALKRHQPLKVCRMLRKRLRVLRYHVQTLYDLRVIGKQISYKRWLGRHAQYPEGPPDGQSVTAVSTQLTLEASK